MILKAKEFSVCRNFRNLPLRYVSKKYRKVIGCEYVGVVTLNNWDLTTEELGKPGTPVWLWVRLEFVSDNLFSWINIITNRHFWYPIHKGGYTLSLSEKNTINGLTRRDCRFIWKEARKYF